MYVYKIPQNYFTSKIFAVYFVIYETLTLFDMALAVFSASFNCR